MCRQQRHTQDVCKHFHFQTICVHEMNVCRPEAQECRQSETGSLENVAFVQHWMIYGEELKQFETEEQRLWLKASGHESEAAVANTRIRRKEALNSSKKRGECSRSTKRAHASALSVAFLVFSGGVSIWSAEQKANKHILCRRRLTAEPDNYCGVNSLGQENNLLHHSAEYTVPHCSISTVTISSFPAMWPNSFVLSFSTVQPVNIPLTLTCSRIHCCCVLNWRDRRTFRRGRCTKVKTKLLCWFLWQKS